MFRVWNEMNLVSKIITVLFIVACIFACYFGFVNGTESAEQTINTITNGLYY